MAIKIDEYVGAEAEVNGKKFRVCESCKKSGCKKKPAKSTKPGKGCKK